MKQWKLSAIALSVLLLGVVFAPKAHADEYNKMEIVTFPQDIQVPGVVLPAGQYVFKLMDSTTTRTIVQIFNADGTHLITTIQAIADYRGAISDKTIMSFLRQEGQPEALKAWFYPGDNYGVEFIYPKQSVDEEAAQSNQQPAAVSPAAATNSSPSMSATDGGNTR